MAVILKVMSASGKTTMYDNVNGNQDVRYLTLGDKNPASGNRYYVSLTGKVAEIEWREGDCIMVELSLLAFKHDGWWTVAHPTDKIELKEIGTDFITGK